MSKIVMLVGVPGSGKTTYAKYLEKEEGYVRLSQDEIYRIPKKMSLTEYTKQRIKESVESGKDVVLDGTYVNRGYRFRMVQFCKELDAELYMCVFKATLDDCIKHNNEKTGMKPSERKVRQLYSVFQEPTEDECENITEIDSDWFSKQKQ